MRGRGNRQGITTQSNASPLPGCFSTPPFISLPSAAFNRLTSQKNCSPSPFGSYLPVFHHHPFRHPCLEHVPSEEKNIEGRRKKKNDSGERRFKSYVRWFQLSSCSAI
ncbi:hypothetical protein CEXT_395211 [Caerostris extrusa]|uniref:Uncharacterized protein n=1 Tax=Caerostris extrusa TaxID=172846 RepID=A0AAV4W976_CAEEX|nr:hypothetical protein CEXT_395211 [Caerostris extrusa]